MDQKTSKLNFPTTLYAGIITFITFFINYLFFRIAFRGYDPLAPQITKSFRNLVFNIRASQFGGIPLNDLGVTAIAVAGSTLLCTIFKPRKGFLLSMCLYLIIFFIKFGSEGKGLGIILMFTVPIALIISTIALIFGLVNRKILHYGLRYFFIYLLIVCLLFGIAAYLKYISIT